MDLAQKVFHYYLENLDDLPFDKQFHFASRLSSWQGDPECQKILTRLKPQLVDPDVSAVDTLQNIIINLPKTSINAAQERAPFFVKYPELRGLMLALFRVRHSLYIYDLDIRSALTQIVPESHLHDLAKQLADDDTAIRILSTYAINFMYLVDHVLYPGDNTSIDIARIYGLGASYDLTQKSEILLLIYLYTHCIIGETNFYERGVSEVRKPAYLQMISQLEKLIHDHYDDCNLDNKLEFLVCCRILGYESALFERIYMECEQSVSSEGTFLVDTMNQAAQEQKTSFALSEHRNVLFIMSTSPYPHA